VVLTAGEDGKARLWDAKIGNAVGKPLIHESAVMTAQFSPEGNLLFTGSHDGRLCLWRTADQALLVSCLLGEPILAGDFSHDGKRIVIGAGNGAHVFDVNTGKLLDPPLLHRDLVRAVAFSPDDSHVLTASQDCTAQLWETANRTRKGLAFSHAMPLLGGSFSPDGRLVLTRSADGTARLWDVATGRSVGPPLRHAGHVWAGAFSPDGKRYATGSSGRTARLWQTPEPWSGSPADVIRRTEVLTGMEVDENEGIRVLDAAAWQERRQQTAAGENP
jgi:WD40 repeat protein